MKFQTVATLASLLSLSVAAPVAECVATTRSCTVITTTITTTSVPSRCAAAGATPAVVAVAGVNIQTFTGTLGGPPPPVISGTGDRPFSVDGDTFVGSGAALGRSCDVQHNACADAANSGQISGGVGVCDQQDTECHQSISLSKRHLQPRAASARSLTPRALDLGTCSNPTILFEDGLDGRTTAAFIAANQQDFDHGSALNIAVIAGFICQRLGSPCSAPAAAQAACTSASAAAVAATQDQTAANIFNSIISAGSPAVAAVATSAAAVVGGVMATTASAALVAMQTGIVVKTITSCT